MNEQKQISESVQRLREAGKLIRQVRLTYYQINQVFLSSGIDVKGNSGAFSILSDIYFLGPKTIPELLEERAITRQSIHSLIQSLKTDGIVKYVDNPEHKSSKKIALTRNGKRYFLEKLKVVDKTMQPIADMLTDDQIASALETVSLVRDGLRATLKEIEDDSQ